MEVFYADSRLRDLCTSFKELCARFGQVGAKRVLQRIQFLEQSDSIDEVLQGPGRCHPLGKDFKGGYYKDCFSSRLDGGWRLVFRLMTDVEKKTHGARTDQAALVVEIIDYHDG